jgi:hypothetical protein
VRFCAKISGSLGNWPVVGDRAATGYQRDNLNQCGPACDYVSEDGEDHMRIAALLSVAALMVAVIVTVAPNVSVYDEASFDAAQSSVQLAAR